MNIDLHRAERPATVIVGKEDNQGPGYFSANINYKFARPVPSRPAEFSTELCKIPKKTNGMERRFVRGESRCGRLCWAHGGWKDMGATASFMADQTQHLYDAAAACES